MMKRLTLALFLALSVTASALAEIPQVITRAKNSVGSSTTHNITLPSGIAAGDLIVIFSTFRGTGQDDSWPGGWDNRSDVDCPTSICWQNVYTRLADGTEGATVTVTTTSSRKSNHVAMRVTGQATSGTVVEVGTTTGNSNAPNPPNLAPAGGAKDYLWIAGFGMAQGSIEGSVTPPAFFINTQFQSNSTGSETTAASTEMMNRVASFNPAAFATGQTGNHVALTMVVYPNADFADYPSLAAKTSSNEPDVVTSHDVTMPPSVSSGDLLQCLFTSSIATFTWPAGWTVAKSLTGAAAKSELAYRQSDGTEGAAIVVSTSLSVESAHICMRIVGHVNPATQAPQASTGATGLSTTANPDTVTPTGGSKNYLFVALAGNSGGSGPPTYTGFPSGYHHPLEQISSTGAGTYATAMATRQLNAASEDPGTFTNPSVNWVALTAAVHPTPSGATRRRLIFGDLGNRLRDWFLAPRSPAELQLARVQ
jgi:hypothetical protein